VAEDDFDSTSSQNLYFQISFSNNLEKFDDASETFLGKCINERPMGSATCLGEEQR
jgi:hypothetical protein